MFDSVQFQKVPVIGILRNYSPKEISGLVANYYQVGFRTIEVTLNTEGALSVIKDLVNSYPEMNVGAGTVCQVNQIKPVIDVGASFIVSPICDESMIIEARDAGLAVFPGAFSPTEIYRAWHAGATAVKLFPANELGPSYLKSILGPLSDVKIIAVGGVHSENMLSFIDAGAIALGMGSSLFPRNILDSDDRNLLVKHLTGIYDLIAESDN